MYNLVIQMYNFDIQQFKLKFIWSLCSTFIKFVSEINQENGSSWEKYKKGIGLSRRLPF